jgi:hypothetical protein
MATYLTFTPTRSDLMRAGLLGIVDRRGVFYSFTLFFVILPWLSALVGALMPLFGLPSVGWTIVLLMAVVPFATVLSFALIPVWLFRDAPTLKGPHHNEFSDQDIHASGPGFDTSISWGVFTHFRFYSLGLILRGNKVPMITVPRRAVSASVQQELEALFKSKGIMPSSGGRSSV